MLKKNKALKLTQANKQIISGTGNTNNTLTSTVNIAPQSTDNAESVDTNVIDPEIQKVLDENKEWEMRQNKYLPCSCSTLTTQSNKPEK